MNAKCLLPLTFVASFWACSDADPTALNTPESDAPSSPLDAQSDPLDAAPPAEDAASPEDAETIDAADAESDTAEADASFADGETDASDGDAVDAEAEAEIEADLPDAEDEDGEAEDGSLPSGDASGREDGQIDPSDLDAHLPSCGDGVLDRNEGCDDHNNENGDGCDFDCQREEGYICKGEPSLCTPACDFNGICDGLEISALCPEDCTPQTPCNRNGLCDDGEDESNCLFDCGHPLNDTPETATLLSPSAPQSGFTLGATDAFDFADAHAPDVFYRLHLDAPSKITLSLQPSADRDSLFHYRLALISCDSNACSALKSFQGILLQKIDHPLTLPAGDHLLMVEGFSADESGSFWIAYEATADAPQCGDGFCVDETAESCPKDCATPQNMSCAQALEIGFRQPVTGHLNLSLNPHDAPDQRSLFYRLPADAPLPLLLTLMPETQTAPMKLSLFAGSCEAPEPLQTAEIASHQTASLIVTEHSAAGLWIAVEPTSPAIDQGFTLTATEAPETPPIITEAKVRLVQNRLLAALKAQSAPHMIEALKLELLDAEGSPIALITPDLCSSEALWLDVCAKDLGSFSSIAAERRPLAAERRPQSARLTLKDRLGLLSEPFTSPLLSEPAALNAGDPCDTEGVLGRCPANQSCMRSPDDRWICSSPEEQARICDALYTRDLEPNGQGFAKAEGHLFHTSHAVISQKDSGRPQKTALYRYRMPYSGHLSASLQSLEPLDAVSENCLPRRTLSAFKDCQFSTPAIASASVSDDPSEPGTAGFTLRDLTHDQILYLALTEDWPDPACPAFSYRLSTQILTPLCNRNGHCDEAEGPGSCPEDCARPSNDLCEEAESLTPGASTPGTTSYARGEFYEGSADVYYRLSLESSGVYRFVLQTEPGFEAMLELLSGCSANAASLGAAYTENQGLVFDASLPAGETVVLVTGADETASGAFLLAVECL